MRKNKFKYLLSLSLSFSFSLSLSLSLSLYLHLSHQRLIWNVNFLMTCCILFFFRQSVLLSVGLKVILECLRFFNNFLWHNCLLFFKNIIVFFLTRTIFGSSVYIGLLWACLYSGLPFPKLWWTMQRKMYMFGKVLSSHQRMFKFR